MPRGEKCHQLQLWRAFPSIGRERLRVRDFIERKLNQPHFGRKHVIPSSINLVRGLQKYCRVKASFGSTFGILKAQLPVIGTTAYPILLKDGKINIPSYKFSKYFRSKRAVESRTRSRPRPII